MKTTDTFIVFTTKAGRRFAFPAHVIAHSKANYYSVQHGEPYDEEYENTVGDQSELYDWALDNMNWDDVEPYAVELPRLEIKEDLQEQWMKGALSSPMTPQEASENDQVLCEKLYYALQECEKREKQE